MKGLDPDAVLLVEDDEDARQILAMMLSVRFPNLVFHLADNGRTGLENFKKYHPAIVITDVNMPIMNGIALAEEINRIAAEVRYIFLTAFSDKAILEASRSAGVEIDHYLMKPIDYRKLLTAIKDCLSKTSRPGSGPQLCDPKLPPPEARGEDAGELSTRES